MSTDPTTGIYVGPDSDPDKYRLLRMVGSGGEAELWKAELTVAGGKEPVAVKVLRPEHNGDFAKLSTRWSEQAELLRFVRHRGVVGVREPFEGGPMHGPGEGANGERTLFLVMNWVDGISLRDWAILNQGPQAALAALQHLEQVAPVLDLLHSGRALGGRPLVHGDLSPGNVMIDDDGQAVLVDFGLIRVAEHQTGTPMLTAGYAAPETWTLGEYSPAADRYSFGALTYFALTGGPPPADEAQRNEIFASSPVLAGRNEANIAALLTIFSVDPDERPPTAVQWIQLLRNTATTTVPPDRCAPSPPSPVIDHPPPALQALRPQPRRRRRWVAVLVALVALGIGGALAAAALRPDTNAIATDGRGVTSIAPTPATEVAPTARSQPTSVAPSTSVESGAAGAPSVRRETGQQPVVLSDGYSIDLDSRNPNWDVTSGPYGDLSLRREYLYGRYGTDLAQVSGMPNYEVCRAATLYVDEVDLSAIDPGATFCIRTGDDGRFAFITITTPATPLIMDITVWEPTAA